MPSEPLASDTSAEVEAMQVDAWRRMTPAEKAAVVRSLTRTVFELARAGVRQRYPGASPREQFLRLAAITLGEELARKVYPDFAQLDSR